ncbi:BtrH N-terminal domain-containing protein [Chitinophaga sp.]|uniref:BtrH N-terminal domain-containing protein n=1 Tax=Chitinophaga sp. TaxID=1869181 RepID=UPI0031DD73E8
MIINHLQAFSGQHCETTATGTLLLQQQISLSEPMLFGLGEGLGFIFWHMKAMDFPFIGGRVKPDVLTENIAANLRLQLTVKETSSARKAWEEVKALLNEGQAVGLKLDCYHLEYFSKPFHFAGHYTAIYGYDDANAFLVDTLQQGGRVKTSLESLAKARAEKGPMASKNLYYTLHKGKPYNLDEAVRNAIRNNAKAYLHPPITNIGYKGILKTAGELEKWFNTSSSRERDFCTTAMMMEKAGTGGALFRNLYRDFLQESYALLRLPVLQQAHEAFVNIAAQWTAVSSLLDEAGRTEDVRPIREAAAVLKKISAEEQTAMGLLADVPPTA